MTDTLLIVALLLTAVLGALIGSMITAWANHDLLHPPTNDRALSIEDRAVELAEKIEDVYAGWYPPNKERA